MFVNKSNSLKALSSIFLIFTMGFLSCNRPSLFSKNAGKQIQNVVSAVIETDPEPQRKNDDSADDPAIWIDFANPAKSIIIGTDKKGGIVTYNLQGKELNYYFKGKMNNGDLRYNYNLNGDTIDILAVSNRTYQSISLFKIRENGVLDTLHTRIIKSQMTEEVYGLCMYKSKLTGKFFVFVNSKAGEVEQWEIFNEKNRADARLVRSFALETQTEGMVADDESGIIYIGEEDAGIFKFNAEPNGSTTGTYIKNSSEENSNIKYDIEGLAIYDTGNGNGYLIASSQGNYSFAVFERQGENKYLKSFKITDGKIDGVEETDGIDVTNVSLPGFPKGFLVVQDGYNFDGHKKKSQNFKIVQWEEIEKILKAN